MSLIILANDFPPASGGIQRYLWGLAAALHRGGEEVLVIAPDQPGAQGFDMASPLPLVRVPAGSRLQTAWALAKAAAQAIRKQHPDNPVRAIVAGNWWPDGLAAWLVRRRTGTPYVVMGYGREMIQTGNTITAPSTANSLPRTRKRSRRRGTSVSDDHWATSSATLS